MNCLSSGESFRGEFKLSLKKINMKLVNGWGRGSKGLVAGTSKECLADMLSEVFGYNREFSE